MLAHSSRNHANGRAQSTNDGWVSSTHCVSASFTPNCTQHQVTSCCSGGKRRNLANEQQSPLAGSKGILFSRSFWGRAGMDGISVVAGGTWFLGTMLPVSPCPSLKYAFDQLFLFVDRLDDAVSVLVGKILPAVQQPSREIERGDVPIDSARPATCAVQLGSCPSARSEPTRVPRRPGSGSRFHL